MRKIREVLRLKFDYGLSVRKIARSLGIGHSRAGDYRINLKGESMRKRAKKLTTPGTLD